MSPVPSRSGAPQRRGRIFEEVGNCHCDRKRRNRPGLPAMGCCRVERLEAEPRRDPRRNAARDEGGSSSSPAARYNGNVVRDPRGVGANLATPRYEASVLSFLSRKRLGTTGVVPRGRGAWWWGNYAASLKAAAM
ncbi:hypothetical protein DL766_010221 [Monosporascus sp. MC13-8B]|uniref:Uncharacterized protein n=1 Tax=Monosporascus cannonballus TaxID=155416 RepID=A0ABY0GSK1_9PEZI|nr:hypothetical protein DL762_009856 [Monosporascus cannonballus]RYP06460.1 hypothetical protein DL766_010221 [Monosporascus sp. MC13-8B]